MYFLANVVLLDSCYNDKFILHDLLLFIFNLVPSFSDLIVHVVLYTSLLLCFYCSSEVQLYTDYCSMVYLF